MAQVVVTVEAYDEESETWKLVGKPHYGEEEDVMQDAEALRDRWVDQGWSTRDIRIVKSPFKVFNKKVKDDD